MKHLYINSDGEVVAADSKFQACKYHDLDLGGVVESEIDVDDWNMLPDSMMLGYTTEDGKYQRKSAKDWAEECPEPILHSSTYA